MLNVSETSTARSGKIPRHPARLSGSSAILGYVVTALFSVVCLATSPLSPMMAALSGAATSAAYLHGYLRLHPRWVGIELALITLAGFFFFEAEVVAWFAASGLVGAGGAVLCAGGAREDHHFFLPPVLGLLAFAAILAIQKAAPGYAVQWYGDAVAEIATAMETLLLEPQNADILADLGERDRLPSVTYRLAVISVCVVFAGWVVMLWLLGQIVRRRAGRALGLGGTILLFRVRPAYIFVLIAGLIFEILCVWFEQDRLRLVSYPLFGLCAAGFWLDSLGVLVFLLALGRAASKNRSGWGLRFFALVAVVLSFYVGPLVGLADIWFDFRKMGQIKSPLN